MEVPKVFSWRDLPNVSGEWASILVLAVPRKVEIEIVVSKLILS